MRSSCLGVVLLAVVAACSSSSSPKKEETATTASPIINGNVDTTHQAVVALILQSASEGGLCSGTIIKTDPTTHIGWVLTAAHCVDDVPPYYALQGNDFQATSGVLKYDVLDYVADPGYDKTNVSSPHDFGIVRIIGVDATTPVIPMAGANDTLAVGTNVESVGYGRTTLMSAGATDTNTLRHNVMKTVTALSSAQLGYDQADDGICSGDSGGPSLVTIGGVQMVAGVHSYVQGDCDGKSVSGRVSYGLSFINAQLAKAAPTYDCNLCGEIANDGNGQCAQLNAACLADTECSAYYQCLSAGKETQAACLAEHPKAEGPFNAATSCVCDRACASLCGATPSCSKVPKCGFALPTDDCGTCTEGACCDQTLDCTADGTCYLCLKDSDADAECATNPARQALAACVASSCGTQCGVSPDGGTTDDDGGAPASSGGTSTVTTSGCALGAARGGERRGAALLALVAMVALARRRRR